MKEKSFSAQGHMDLQHLENKSSLTCHIDGSNETETLMGQMKMMF